jgi:hypothetical protein
MYINGDAYNGGMMKIFLSSLLLLLVPLKMIAAQSQQNASIESAPSIITSQQHDASFWNSVKDSENIRVLQLYLDAFPQGLFIDQAKMKIAQIQETANQEQHAAIVYIYHSNSDTKPSIYLNGLEIARLPSHQYLHFKLLPGTYEFDSDRYKNKPITLELLPEKEYFLTLSSFNVRIEVKSKEEAMPKISSFGHIVSEWVFDKGYEKGKILKSSAKFVDIRP